MNNEELLCHDSSNGTAVLLFPGGQFIRLDFSADLSQIHADRAWLILLLWAPA